MVLFICFLSGLVGLGLNRSILPIIGDNKQAGGSRAKHTFDEFAFFVSDFVGAITNRASCREHGNWAGLVRRFELHNARPLGCA
jgi:hypothetical protein